MTDAVTILSGDGFIVESEGARHRFTINHGDKYRCVPFVSAEGITPHLAKAAALRLLSDGEQIPEFADAARALADAVAETWGG